MKTRLVSYRENEIDLVFPLDRPRITIGRDLDNMIQLPDEKVSKHHAVICRTKDGWAIEDSQSRNGVFVNGTRAVRAELKDKDRVKIGPHEFFFEMNDTAEDLIPAYIIHASARIRSETIIDDGSAGKP